MITIKITKNMGRYKYDIMVKPLNKELNQYQIRFTNVNAMNEFVELWRNNGVYSSNIKNVRLGKWTPILSKQFNNILFGPHWNQYYSITIDVIKSEHLDKGLPVQN